MKEAGIKFIMALLVFVWGASSALAQGRVDKAAHPLIAADQYFREGAFDKALIEYQKAFEIDYNPAIYYNIAQCLHRMEHYEKAILYYELFISKNLSSPLIPHVREHIAQCEAKLQETRKLQEVQEKTVTGPRKVAVVSDPPGAEVFVDAFSGTPAGLTPLMLELDGKSHLLVLRKTGYRDVSRMVDAGTPGMALLQFTLESTQAQVPVSAPMPAPDTPRQTPASLQTADSTLLPPSPCAADVTRQWWFWTGLAATSVFTVSAIVSGLRTLDLQDQWESTGDLSIRDRGERYRAWTDAMVAAALLSGATTGIVVWMFQREHRKTALPARSWRLEPAVSSQSAGFSLTIPF